jgi:hypothetical protein
MSRCTVPVHACMSWGACMHVGLGWPRAQGSQGGGGGALFIKSKDNWRRVQESLSLCLSTLSGWVVYADSTLPVCTLSRIHSFTLPWTSPSPPVSWSDSHPELDADNLGAYLYYTILALYLPYGWIYSCWIGPRFYASPLFWMRTILKFNCT